MSGDNIYCGPICTRTNKACVQGPTLIPLFSFPSFFPFPFHSPTLFGRMVKQLTRWGGVWAVQ